MRRLTLLLVATALCLDAQQGWWMTEPIRWVQTNLIQPNAGLDAARLAGQLADMRANVVLMSMGGIVAFYPPKAEFTSATTYLPAGRDMFGEFLREAHARKIRVVGRFDFSKTAKAVFDRHPEWFFRQANGEPAVYNGLYSTCINGEYYRVQALKILADALERYEVDGLFFNMFGNQSRDYGGRALGLCHCDACQTRYRKMYGKPVPNEPDDEYRRFMFLSSREVAAAIGDLIHQKRPQAGYFNYIQEATDGIMSESNTALARPLPLWPYSASDNVNRARNSQPGKMAVNLCMQFVDYAWRFATVPAHEIALRLWQNVAHGGALAFEVNGTLDQQDRQAVETAKPIFQWLAANEQYYAGQQSAARVLLLGSPQQTGRVYREENYRGLFRLLSEQHIPFAVSDNLEWIGKRQFDLVIAADWAPPELARFAEQGGRVLIASSHAPEFEVARVTRTLPDVEGYVRVRDAARFPSLQETSLLMLDGPFAELAPDFHAALTLVPPSMFAPPEFVHLDQKDTDTPAIASRAFGSGSAVWIPWDLGSLYYRLSLPAYAGLFQDLLAGLNPHPQIRTDAHPLVEMSLMRQGGHTLLHVINLSGHSDTAYHAPIPMRDIHISLAGSFAHAQALRNPAALNLHAASGYTEFVLSRLGDYELVVLD